MDHETLVRHVALAFLPGLGPILIQRLLERYADPEEIAFRLPEAALQEAGVVRPSDLRKIREIRPRLRALAEAEVERCPRLGVRLLVRGDPSYPGLARSLDDPPPVVWIRGSLPHGPVRVAVVGSRRATAIGRRTATAMGADLAARGCEIVSGGARGIDSCAHRGALEGGGRTVAVLGSGLARPYPVEHGPLFAQIADRGAVVSEFPLDTPPLPENFPRRNRLISGLSVAVVVVEAGLRSGSLHTARHALDQGRDVFAMPGSLEAEQAQGCHGLLRNGAIFVRHAADVVEDLPAWILQHLSAGAPEPPAGPASHGATPDERAVARLLAAPGGADFDELSAGFAGGSGRLHAALLGLELRGAVDRWGGRYYLARPRKELETPQWHEPS